MKNNIQDKYQFFPPIIITSSLSESTQMTLTCTSRLNYSRMRTWKKIKIK
uniref:Ig-like domain-containing protein n=1 Tax=Anguilla anguilla TaxID=7936 RepID=A0A0E9SJF9_ANGAN